MVKVLNYQKDGCIFVINTKKIAPKKRDKDTL